MNSRYCLSDMVHIRISGSPPNQKEKDGVNTLIGMSDYEYDNFIVKK